MPDPAPLEPAVDERTGICTFLFPSKSAPVHVGIRQCPNKLIPVGPMFVHG